MARFFGAIWAPFEGLNPWWGLVVLSLVFSVLALLAMKYCSNQRRIEALKDRYQGHVLAIRLFRDDFPVVIGSLVKTLGNVGLYLGHQLRPMAVLLVPFMLIFAQMQMRLAYRPLPVGEKVYVTVELASLHPGEDAEVKLKLPPGVSAAGKPARIPSEQRVIFPLVPVAPGEHVLEFTCGTETVKKTLHAGGTAGTPMVSPVRSLSFEDAVLYPGENRFDARSPFARIAFEYPIRPLSILGFDAAFGKSWGMGLWFVLLSIVGALLLKGFFGVTI